MLRIQWILLIDLLLFVSSINSQFLEEEAGDDSENPFVEPYAPPPSSSSRHLQQQQQPNGGKWDAFNNLIYNAVLNFPDSELSSAGLTLKVTQLQCTDVRVNDITLETDLVSQQQLKVTTSITGLDMICTARYEFYGLLIVNGDGDLYVESKQNAASTDTIFTSLDYTNYPPHDSMIEQCQPKINIDKLEFSNGGFWGWTLDTLEGLFRGRFEDMAESRLCQELEDMSTENLDTLLNDMQNELVQYPESILIDPLATETALTSPQQKLINWQQPDSYPFGFWFDQAWNETVAFLNKQVDMPGTGGKGMNANLLLQENLLDATGAMVVNVKPKDQIIYEGHDQWTQTTVKLTKLSIRGLDTLTTLDPMVTIGKYTLQSKLSWENLWLELELTLDILPSSQEDSYITGGNANAGISERVTVQFSLKQVNAGVSVLLALDQQKVEALKVGHFLDKDNILPCFLSSIHQVEVSALSVEAIDLQAPTVSGFVSQGLDHVISSAIQAGFLMYESSMLRSSKAFFQLAIRDVVNDSLQAQQATLGVDGCQLWQLSRPHGTVDVRDLLLAPEVAVWMGGGGQERYGNLFHEFVMPTLYTEVLTDDNVNDRFIRPLTLEQSGEQGTIMTSPDDAAWIDFVQEDFNGTSWVSLLGWERFQFQALDATVRNMDTVTSPVEVLNPKTGLVLENTIRTGDATPNRPLEFTMRLSISGDGRDVGVPDMSNEVEVSLTIPSTLIAFDMLVAMNETSLLHLPLKDLDNEFCWLATLTPGSDHLALDLERIVANMSSFTFDVACVSCSSPGGAVLPEILATMKEAGLTTTFQPHLEDLLSEVTLNAWANMNFPAMIQDAPRLCPHYPSYDADVVPRNNYGVANGFAATPQWSRQSMETITAIGFLSAYTSLFVLAKNHLLQPNVDQEPMIMQASIGEGGRNSTGAAGPTRQPNLLDWTNLSATLGPWADDVLDEARLTLQAGVTNDSLDSKRRLKNIFQKNGPKIDSGKSRLLQADSLIRDYLLDEDGSMNIAFEDLQFEFAGISFSLSSARVFGVDSITYLDPFIVEGPQTLQNYVQLQELDIELDLQVRMGKEVNNMTISFAFFDVALELPLVLAMDLDKLGLIELGSILKVSQILPCLLEGAHEVYIPRFNLTIGTMERPTVSGLLSPDLLTAVTSMNDVLFDTYGNDLAVALPGIFDSTLRRTLNNRLDQYVRQVDPSLCAVDAGNGNMDFRDLFLPQNESKSLGGTGMQQYGDLFRTIYDVLREELVSENGNPPPINSLIASWTAEQSNVSGALYIPGMLLDTTSLFTLGGLNATLAFQLGEISLENLDSLGSPLSLLDPLDGTTLNNTASFGVGGDPLKVNAKLMVAVSDNKDMDVRNEVDISVDLYGVSAVATVLLRIAEDAFLTFPLKDVTNPFCWLSTIVASTDEYLGVALTGHALRLHHMDLNVSCLSCSSPQFGDLISDLYAPTDGEDATNGEDATDTVLQTLSQILDGDAIQDFLDQVVRESSSKCPHSDDYDASALITASQYLQNQAEPFGFTDFTARDERSSYFNIASGIFAACLVLFFIVLKVFIWHRNRKWKQSLTEEGMFLLRRQQAKEREQETMIDMHSTSLFKSPDIPRNVRLLVPVLILVNIGLYLGGHLGVLSTVDVEVHLAGEDFTIHNFLVFSFIDSTAKTYQNGGMEMSIMIWIFTGIWPYVKLLASLFLWFVPPRLLSVGSRGKALLWIDALTKLSIVDIFTMILFLAVLLVYIGGPDEALDAEGALYSMKVIVIPGASCYCIVIAQRMSRVSSRFFLDYHDDVVAAAREACARGDITEVYKEKDMKQIPEASRSDSSSGLLHNISSVSCSSSRKTPPNDSEANTRLADTGPSESNVEGGPSNPRNVGISSAVDAGDFKTEQGDPCKDKETPADIASEINNASSKVTPSDLTSDLTKDPPSPERHTCLSRLTSLSVHHLGVAFGGLTVLVLAIIGCIYAPSVSVEISDLWGLALEAEATFEEAATEYGVFAIVSAVLLQSRFVLDTTWDYVALGFLLTVAFVSVGIVFFIGCYRFLMRLFTDGWSALKQGQRTFELPSYLRLYAYRHIEIYVVAVIVGCWQLGSVSIYAIHLYCSILDAVYKVLTYIGLAETSTAQCYEAQMLLPDNLLIFFGALIILLGQFCVQCSKQYQKNKVEASDLLRHDDFDVEHHSSLWNTSSKRGFWSTSKHLLLNRTATFSAFSDDGSEEDENPRNYLTPTSSPLAVVVEPTAREDVSTISGGPSRNDQDHPVRVSRNTITGTLFGDGHRVIASVDQFSTPQ